MAADVTTTHCPPTADLERLVRGRLTEARAAAIAEHIGSCSNCQQRLDAISGSCDDITSNLRECTKDTPSSDSAYYKALAAAEDEVRATAAFLNGSADTHPIVDEKLDFLQPTDEPGRLGKLGTFGVLRIVGRGGMGVVLHAYDPCLARDVAIKVIDPKLAHNEVARQRFCREARAAAAVTHDNLVAVHQVDEDEASGLPYLVMQLINGESLEQRLKRVGKLSPLEVARLGMQAAAGLAAAHAGGLIHRDIKPANILLEAPADRVKLTDFGLARAAEDVKLTRTGFVAGSPLYMAPEQARGDEIDHRADLFSLGSVLCLRPRRARRRSMKEDAARGAARVSRMGAATTAPLNRTCPSGCLKSSTKLLAKNPPTASIGGRVAGSVRGRAMRRILSRRSTCRPMCARVPLQGSAQRARASKSAGRVSRSACCPGSAARCSARWDSGSSGRREWWRSSSKLRESIPR